jgi:1-acyl-sn-glycerol-3-phosphate acyltransferase
MRAFKPGAFELALDCQRPILPIVIRGTADALPKRGFVLRGRHPIVVTILEPLPFTSFEGASAEELTQRVRSVIASHLGQTLESSRAA